MVNEVDWIYRLTASINSGISVRQALLFNEISIKSDFIQYVKNDLNQIAEIGSGLIEYLTMKINERKLDIDSCLNDKCKILQKKFLIIVFPSSIGPLFALLIPIIFNMFKEF